MFKIGYEEKKKVDQLFGAQLPSFRNKALRDLDRMEFQSEGDFNNYLEELETMVSNKEEKQPRKGGVIDGNVAPDMSKVSDGVKAYVDQKKSGVSEFGGKTGDE